MAADFTAEVERAAGHIEARWSPERAAAILRGVHGRKRRRGQRRVLGALAAVLVLVVLSPRLVSSVRERRGKADRTSLAGVAKVPGVPSGVELALAAPPLHLRDGSVARPQGAASQVRLREDRPGRTVVELVGAAQFEVVHDPRRLFRVETRDLAVEVLGTRFVVEEQGLRARVTVQEGRVRVLWASHYDELDAGQSAVFPPPAPPGVAEPAAAVGPAPPLHEPAPPAATPKLAAGALSTEPEALPRSRARHGAPRPEPSPSAVLPSPVREAAPELALTKLEPSSWQTLAHEGLFDQAYRLAYGAPAAVHGAAEPLSRERAGSPSHDEPGASGAAEPPLLRERAPDHGAAGTPGTAEPLPRERAGSPGHGEAVAHNPAEPPLLRERTVAPSELLLLADVARLSHHPADAMAPLSRLLREHAADPRAPLAAFTLGRVLLDDLGRPREAAQSFVRVQELDPDGPLSQDALAREVEAWSRAGEAASAHTRAMQYVQKYPAGRRLRSVRLFGELW